jgi:hypothetical protein
MNQMIYDQVILHSRLLAILDQRTNGSNLSVESYGMKSSPTCNLNDCLLFLYRSVTYLRQFPVIL